MMKNTSKYSLISTVIGILIITVGILLNEWILTFLFSEDNELEFLSKIIIWNFNIICLIVGILFINLKGFPYLVLFVKILKLKVIPFIHIFWKKIHDDIIFRTIILILVLTPLIVYPIYRGIFSPYYEVADQDIRLISEALFYNAGMEPTYFDHTGYINYLIIGAWIDINYILGFIPVSDMNQFFEYAAKNGFGAGMAPIVYSCRILAMILSILFLLSFIYGVYRIYENWSYALLFGLLLSSTTGLMVHSIILRTELLSAYFFMLYLFLFLYSMTKGRFDIKIIFFAGYFAYLSVLAKIQIVVGLLSVPFLMFAYNTENDKNYLTDYTGRVKQFKFIIILSLLFIGPFIFSILNLYQIGKYTHTGENYGLEIHQVNSVLHYLFIPFILLMHAWFFKIIRKISWELTFVLISIFLVGVASAFYLHLIWYDDRFISNTLFFYEKGKHFISGHGGISSDDINILKVLPEIIKGVLISKFNPTVYIGRPITILYPLIFSSIIYYYVRLGMKKTALRSMFLVLFAMGLEALINNIRVIGHPSTQLSALVNSYPQPHYAIYIEFVLLLSLIQFLIIHNDENYHFFQFKSGVKKIEKLILKRIGVTVILIVTILNFNINHFQLRKRQIGIAIDLTAQSLLGISRSVSPLYEFILKNCNNDCDEFLKRGQ